MKYLLTLFFIFLTGCVASGVQVSQEAAMQFKEGVSTESEIVAKLGPPSNTTMSTDFKLIGYSGFQSKAKAASFIPYVGAFIGGSDYAVTSVQYQIDKNGILQKIYYSNHAGGSRMGSTPAEMQSREPSAVK